MPPEHARREGINKKTQKNKWSGKRDSNPRHPAWKAGALPPELFPLATGDYSTVSLRVKHPGSLRGAKQPRIFREAEIASPSEKTRFAMTQSEAKRRARDGREKKSLQQRPGTPFARTGGIFAQRSGRTSPQRPGKHPHKNKQGGHCEVVVSLPKQSLRRASEVASLALATTDWGSRDDGLGKLQQRIRGEKRACDDHGFKPKRNHRRNSSGILGITLPLHPFR